MKEFTSKEAEGKSGRDGLMLSGVTEKVKTA